ncbi:MAG: VanZ family protein [Planctomycetota bacterium]
MRAMSAAFRHRIEPWLGRLWFWRAASGLGMASIFASSHRSFSIQDGGLPSGSMNVLHFVVYAVLAVCCAFGGGAAIAEGGDRGRRFGFGVAAATLFGLGDELHQSFIPGRFCSFFDLVVDGLGATFGVLVARELLARPSDRRRGRRVLALALLVSGVWLALQGYRLWPRVDGWLNFAIGAD